MSRMTSPPLVAGVYPSDTPGLKLRLYNPQIETVCPWRYFTRFIPAEWGSPLYSELVPLCPVRGNRCSCLFSSVSELKVDSPQTNSEPPIQSGYGNLAIHDWSRSPILIEIKKRVEGWTRETFDYCLAHIYRDGRDSIAWHNDKEALNPSTSVVSVSLGATRKFRFRILGKTSGWLVEYRLTAGTMIWMQPSMRPANER